MPALDGVEHRYVDHGDGVTIHVITADLTYGYAERISDFEGELVDDFGHWSVEQRSKLLLDRIPGVLSSRNLNYGGAFRGRVACIV